MKKTLACIALLASLAGCGGQQAQAQVLPSPTPSPTPTVAVVSGIARPAPECVTLDGPQIDTTWRVYGWLGTELKVWDYNADLLMAQTLANKTQVPDLQVTFVWYCPPAV